MVEPAEYDVLSVVDVPDRFRERWQKALNTLADLLQVQAALVMRVHERHFEVFARSLGAGMVFEEGENAPPDICLYCEKVISNHSELAVSNALADPELPPNPDIAREMVSYLGLPLDWPTGEVFGTICVLDARSHEYSARDKSTLEQCRDFVQDELALMFENQTLSLEIAKRQISEQELRETQSHLQSLVRSLQIGRERERAMLARGLHDEIMQNLTAVKMDIDACVRRLADELLPGVNESLRGVDLRLTETIRRIREMCDTLVPAVLEDLGLAAAIDWAVADFRLRSGVACEMHMTQDELRISPEAQCLLFRILQQALTHAGASPAATRTIVELVQHKRAIAMRVALDGNRREVPEWSTSEFMDLGDLQAQVASWGGKLRTWHTPERVAYLEVRLPSVDADSER